MADLTVQLSDQYIGTPNFFDLTLGPTNDLQITDGPSGISLAVNQRLRAYIGDFFLDLESGVLSPSVFSQRGGLTQSFEAALQATILQTPGVIALLSWSASLDSVSRRLSVAFEAQVAGGVIVFNAPIDTSGAS